MKSLNRLKTILASSVLGGIVGSSMGLAFAGGAIALGWPLAILGAVSAFLFTKRTTGPTPEANQLNLGGDIEAHVASSDQTDEQDHVGTILSVGDKVVAVVSSIPCWIWNGEMSLLRSIGLMGYFAKGPWLFIALAAALIFLLLPVGIVFTVSGIFALSRNPSAENDFKV